MIQIFIVGTSLAYGNGAKSAGWGDLIKSSIHSLMYGESGVGEKYEVYNFAKPGSTIDFVQDEFPALHRAYARGDKLIVIASIGGNNSKAIGSPDNFVSTIEDYSSEIERVLALLKSKSDNVIIVDNGYVNESVTNPKLNPLTGTYSYFTNERRSKFSLVTKELCSKYELVYVETGIDKDTWVEKYLYEDGVHPNDSGYQLIFEAIKRELDPLL